MKSMKKLLGIILTLSLVIGMIMPSMNTKAEGTATKDISQVKSFQVVATKTLMEGDTQLAPVPEGYEPYFQYEPSKTEPRVIVTFTDDTVQAYSQQELFQTFGQGCGFSSEQSATNVWGIGKHTASAHFAGKTVEFEVEIVENPVKSVEGIYHGILVEGMLVEWNTQDIEFIFTFSDGSKESFGFYDEVEGEVLRPNLIPEDINDDGSWDAGEHYFTGTTHGRNFRVKVNVLSLEETPIKSLKVISAKDLVAEWHAVGMPGQEYFGVDACNPKVEITYRDDTKEILTYEALRNKYDGVTPKLFMENTSLEGTGERIVDLEFYGRKCSFPVNVIENPVESVSAITTKPLVKGWRGFYSLVLDGGMILTVTYKDGTKVSGTPNEMLDIFYDYPQETAPDKEYNLGKNSAEVEFIGKMFNVDFEIIEDPNPITGLDVKVRDDAVLYENTGINGEIKYEYGHLLDVVLTYKDGSKLTGDMVEVNQLLENISIKEVMTRDTQDEEQWGVGTHKAYVYYGFSEFEKEISVEIVENPYEKATISNTDGLTIVLEKASGEKETYVAKDFAVSGSRGSNIAGYIATDKGMLPVEINFGGGRRADYTKVSSMYIYGVKSNELQGCTWLEQQMLVRMYGDVPETALNHSAEELKNLVLTDMDYEMGRTDSVKAEFVISEKESVATEEQALLDKATETLDNYEEGIVVDLSLYKEYQNRQKRTVTEKVPEPNGKVSITMAVPEEILASGTNPENIKMVRIHNGETTVLPCTYDKESKTITFETDKFSTYSMVYEVVDNSNDGGVGDGTGNGAGTTGGAGTSSSTPSGAGTSSSTSSSNKSPNTGDTNAVMGYSVMCMVALAAVIMMKRRNSFAK